MDRYAWVCTHGLLSMDKHPWAIIHGSLSMDKCPWITAKRKPLKKHQQQPEHHDDVAISVALVVLPLANYKTWTFWVFFTFFGLVNLAGLNLILATIVVRGLVNRTKYYPEKIFITFQSGNFAYLFQEYSFQVMSFLGWYITRTKYYPEKIFISFQSESFAYLFQEYSFQETSLPNC